jgi:hypothetical protein
VAGTRAASASVSVRSASAALVAFFTLLDCGGGHNACECERKRLYRKCCAALVAILAPFVIFIVWLVLRPHKPEFYLQDLSVLRLNVTPPASTYPFTTMQATVTARNVNDRVGVYYDRVDVYAQYKNMAITVPARLPVHYQSSNDQDVWSPFLVSTDSVQLPPQLAQDETAGYVPLEGRLLDLRPLPPPRQLRRAAHRQRRQGQLRRQHRRRERLLPIPAGRRVRRRRLAS